ncbi:MAG: extracellular solute-binding protein [Chloroflexi bacterium]|nr:extracellular solute-binding protein [Chloroflexota bacterium]
MVKRRDAEKGNTTATASCLGHRPARRVIWLGVTKRRVVFGAAGATLVMSCGIPGRSEAPRASNVPASRLDVWPLNEGKAVDILLERFKQNAPQITVNREDGANLTKVQTALAAGTPPDIAGAIIANLGDIASKGMAESLTQLLKSQRGWQPDGFLPGLKAVHSQRGELFAAPYITNTTPIAINLELMERANLKLPASNWTYDNLADYATRMTSRTATGQYWGYAAPHTNDFTASNDFNGILNSFGGSYVDAANQKSNFARPEGQAALEWLVTLVRNKQASPLPWPDDWLAPGGQLAGRGRGFVNGPNGGVAMIPLETGGLKPVEQAASFRWQVVVPPRKAKMANHASAGSWFIVKGAPHRAAAVEFIRFAMLPEELARWALEQERIPPHEAAAAHPDWQAFEKRKPAMAVFREAAKGAVTYPAIGGWGDARAAVAAAIGDALQGKATPRAALDEAARIADAALAKARGG